MAAELKPPSAWDDLSQNGYGGGEGGGEGRGEGRGEGGGEGRGEGGGEGGGEGADSVCGTHMSVHARTRDAANLNGLVPVHQSLRLD